MITKLQVPDEQAVRSSETLEAVVQRVGDYTYWYDCGDTIVGDEDCDQITRFRGRTLTAEQVERWCDGYATGLLQGIERGKIEKAQEIKRTLGL